MQIVKAQDTAKVKLPLVDQKIEYTDVITFSDSSAYTKNKLFNAAEEWFASTFGNSKVGLRVDDRENGIVICRGNVLYTKGSEWKQTLNLYLLFYVEVNVKNGKYRYRVYNMTFNSGQNEMDISSEYNSYLHNSTIKKRNLKDMTKDFIFIDEEIKALVTNLKLKMSDTKINNF
jgi:hypothetical protein